MTVARPTFRLFSCARCRKQVLICRLCDRGNLYCSSTCSRRSRQESVRRASRRYQRNPLGARNHARRQRAYRVRQKKVTHQGFAARLKKAKRIRAGFRFASKRSFGRAMRASGTEGPDPAHARCHFCGRESPDFYRYGFLGRKEAP